MSEIPAGELRARIRMFGEWRMVPLEIVKRGRPGVGTWWDKILWVEKPEDEYALLSPSYRDAAVLLVRPQGWRKSPVVDCPGINPDSEVTLAKDWEKHNASVYKKLPPRSQT